MSEIETADTLRKRLGVNRAAFWVLLTGRRWVIAGGFALVVFALFVAGGTVKQAPLRPLMQSSSMVTITFSGLVGATITSATLVVSINQLVLSQEIGSLGTIRNRMDVGTDFRQNTDELLGETTPTDPATYLDELIETSEQRARALREAVAGSNDPELREKIDTYVDDLLGNATKTRDKLADSEFGSLDVVAPAVDYDYNRKIHDGRRIKHEHGNSLTVEQTEQIDALLTALAMYGTARAYLNGLYIQWSLIKLSRAIIYTAVAALLVSAAVALFVDANTLTGSLFGIDTMIWLVSGAFTVAVLPFFVFAAYILRLGTLTKQTLTVEPLLLH
ncbi:hypothetical protein BRD19_03320 [Halobacteriales archaeon SW_7_65_23]|nr:MAG: hypothetical protein BRD19_03320 [Halobacteriales archaeon SW_7_65_23]